MANATGVASVIPICRVSSPMVKPALLRPMIVIQAIARMMVIVALWRVRAAALVVLAAVRATRSIKVRLAQIALATRGFAMVLGPAIPRRPWARTWVKHARHLVNVRLVFVLMMGFAAIWNAARAAGPAVSPARPTMENV